jgi:multimeric flavodoxin WrbA
MKIVTVMGSPRKNGNTATVLGMFEEFVRGEHEVDRIDITDYEIRGCRGCGACGDVLDEPGCVQKDDADALFRRLLDADILVYSSPLYVWGVTAQLKAFLDRHVCLVKSYGTSEMKSLISGKRGAQLITCAGPIEKNADLVPESFRRFGDYGQCRVTGTYTVPFCTTPDALGKEAKSAVETMARDLLRS